MSANPPADGCNEQIAMCKDTEVQELCKKYKVVLRKGNPSRTGSEQAADLMTGHKEVKLCSKMEYGPEATNSELDVEFRAWIGAHPTLKDLPAATKKALFRLLPTLAAVLRKSHSSTKIRKGHVLSGNRTGDSQWPDYQAMLDTRSLTYTKEEMDLLDPAVLGAEPLASANEIGEVLETIWDDKGFPLDRDEDGNAKLRKNTGNERAMRMLVITHPARDRARLAAIDLQDKTALDEWQRKCDDVDKLIKQSKEAEEVCMAITGEQPKTQGAVDTMMRRVTKAQVEKGTKVKGGKAAKLKKAQVLHYVAARTLDLPKGFYTKTNLTSKDDGAQSGTTMFIDVAGKPVLATRPPKPAPRRREPAPALNVPVLVSAAASTVSRSASSYLANPAWRQNARTAFTGTDLPLTPTEAMFARADALATQMGARLTTHLQLRIKGKTMRGHYSFQWFREQIPRLAALITLNGHAVRHPGGCTQSDSLLLNYHAHEDKLFSVRDTEHGPKWGAYLWVDPDGNTVRSGKAAGEGGFLARDGAHLAAATSITADSARNYRTYPSNGSGRTANTHFEDLNRVVATAFDPTDRRSALLICADGPSSIFSWGEHLQKVKKVGFAGKQGPSGHQQQFAAYALELAYDLLIAPAKNVSDSPGFETPIGIHVKGNKADEVRTSGFSASEARG